MSRYKQTSKKLLIKRIYVLAPCRLSAVLRKDLAFCVRIWRKVEFSRYNTHKAQYYPAFFDYTTGPV